MLIINSLEAVNDLLVGRAGDWSDKPASIVIDLTRTSWAFSAMSYGPEWREHRRLFHQQLNHSQVPRYHPIIQEEVALVLSRLLADPKDHRSLLRSALGCIIMRISYGSGDYEYNQQLSENARRLIDGNAWYLTPGNLLAETFPVLRHVPSWFPGAGWKRGLEAIAKLSDQIIAGPFDDTKERLRSGKQKDGNNLATQYIEQLPDEGHPGFARKEQVARNTAAFAYIAGADTTINSTLALILALAMSSGYQEKAQAQLDAVLGTAARLPTFADVEQLPYIRALVMEANRWFNVLPFSLPRFLYREDTYRGYRIPAGTLVLPNTWAIMHDTAAYGADALQFNPERFLKDGKIDPSVLSPKAANFGYGRRICPGRHLSDASMTLLTASLLAVFDIRPARDETGAPRPLSLEFKTSIIIHPDPYDVDIAPRSPAHAALILNLEK